MNERMNEEINENFSFELDYPIESLPRAVS